MLSSVDVTGRPERDASLTSKFSDLKRVTEFRVTLPYTVLGP